MTRVLVDLVDVYIARETGATIEFLQLRRVAQPLSGSWQPVMGHIEGTETAQACAERELGEEVALRGGDPRWLGWWQLEEVHPYFVAALDAVVLSPRFLALVRGDWRPDLSGEAAHDASRWVRAEQTREMFMWPGQWRACEEAAGLLFTRESSTERALRLPLPAPGQD